MCLVSATLRSGKKASPANFFLIKSLCFLVFNATLESETRNAFLLFLHFISFRLPSNIKHYLGFSWAQKFHSPISELDSLYLRVDVLLVVFSFLTHTYPLFFVAAQRLSLSESAALASQICPRTLSQANSKFSSQHSV